RSVGRTVATGPDGPDRAQPSVTDLDEDAERLALGPPGRLAGNRVGPSAGRVRAGSRARGAGRDLLVDADPFGRLGVGRSTERAIQGRRRPGVVVGPDRA